MPVCTSCTHCVHTGHNAWVHRLRTQAVTPISHQAGVCLTSSSWSSQHLWCLLPHQSSSYQRWPPYQKYLCRQSDVIRSLHMMHQDRLLGITGARGQGCKTLLVTGIMLSWWYSKTQHACLRFKLLSSTWRKNALDPSGSTKSSLAWFHLTCVLPTRRTL